MLCNVCIKSGKTRAIRAFTLIEMVLVVALMGIVAGIVVVLTAGAGKTAEDQALTSELVVIRSACLRFYADMGEPPRYIAELMQSPNPADSCGGWWWRTDGAPPERLWSFDPAVGRGWNGPYLKSEFVSSAGQEATEARTSAAFSSEYAMSDDAQGRRLTLLLSDYSTGQKKDGARLLSHYQLDFSGKDEIFVRFVRDPMLPPAAENVAASLGLGIRP